MCVWNTSLRSACKLYKTFFFFLWNVRYIEQEEKKKKKEKEKDGNGKESETKERNENRVNEVAGKRKHFERDHPIHFLHVFICFDAVSRRYPFFFFFFFTTWINLTRVLYLSSHLSNIFAFSRSIKSSPDEKE